MPSLAFILLIVVIGLLVMIPTRRLFLAGWTPPALTTYFLAMLALGLFVAELRGPARYLIPILVLAYIAPFITARDGIGRIRDRLGGRPPVSTRPQDGARPEPGRRGSGGPDARGPRTRGSRPARPAAAGPAPKNVTPNEAPPPTTHG